ncbi:class I adenylate-forming enzyme family protein [Dactylosporangium sp. CA-233914]|uniref:class I adenylate-forming enzyme family protein n=1 Tax=Dactylosporangium sp. CA-233914 TaxID=3239934 RepID=UPI003D8DE660
MTDSDSPATFADVWQTTVANYGEAEFLVFRNSAGGVTTWTYSEFDECVVRVAGALAHAGVGRGGAVHLALRNCPAFVAVWLAAARLGAYIVPVDPESGPRDLVQQVRRTSPTIGFCASSRAAAYVENAGLRVVVALAEDETDLVEGSPLLGGSSASRLTGRPSPSDRLAVMFTSGTTAEPKGVVLTQRNYVRVAQTMAALAESRPDSRWYVTLPLFHANAQYYCFAPAIATGASVALTSSFSASQWVQVAHELEVTHASLFAAPIRMILARTADDARPLRLQHVWFAQSLAAGHFESFARLAGVHPRQLYGMTETIAAVTTVALEAASPDRIGTPVPGREVRVVGADGVQVSGTVPGELWVCGEPGDDLFAGYLRDPIATTAAFHDDHGITWFATGDLVAWDAEGTALQFVGRVDDVIKVAGENVSLTQLEAMLAEAPGVLEAAAVAEPDPMRDQVPVAYVVPHDPAFPPDLDALAEWAASQLTPAARPRRWHIVDALPRTSVGKVRRFRLTGPKEGSDA